MCACAHSVDMMCHLSLNKTLFFYIVNKLIVLAVYVITFSLAPFLLLFSSSLHIYDASTMGPKHKLLELVSSIRSL